MLLPFPSFKALELHDRPQIEAITGDFPNYSDFNFVSLWSWDTRGEIAASVLHGNLVVKFTDYITGEPLYSFIGTNEVDDTIKQVTALARQQGISDALELIPEEAITKIENPEDFEIAEDPNNFDYIISVDSFTALQGQEYEAKRKAINQFKRAYPHVVSRPLDIKDEETQTKIIGLAQLWVELKGHEALEAENELKAIERLLQYSYIFPPQGVGIYDGDKLIAFSIDEIMPDGINALGHFQKADSRYKGIFPFLQKENLSELQKKGVQRLNIEQDLGLESLRRSKIQLRPIEYHKKYFVAVKH
ncbi:MAG TPA: phosphatidylglycerol lysyltransferase domain-containing protein [Candidatus Saccharimonadales bacterium]|nr:phosphatidylglycerol lysyltransferase domain-containing protein [Candidatus Saccharimonadales bacterium]